MRSDPQTDSTAQGITPGETPKQPTNVIALLFQLVFALLAAGMAIYWTFKPFVNFEAWTESTYVKECKALISQTDGVRGYRAQFKEVEDGQTYKIGEPNRTVGYYTALRLIYGDARELIYCHADIGKQFTKAEITIPQIGCFRYFPNGQREIRPSC